MILDLQQLLCTIILSGIVGGAIALGRVWRRLSLVEHLQDTLQDLHDVGCEVQVVTSSRSIAFNQRLRAAKELLSAIEKRP